MSVDLKYSLPDEDQPTNIMAGIIIFVAVVILVGVIVLSALRSLPSAFEWFAVVCMLGPLFGVYYYRSTEKLRSSINPFLFAFSIGIGIAVFVTGGIHSWLVPAFITVPVGAAFSRRPGEVFAHGLLILAIIAVLAIVQVAGLQPTLNMSATVSAALNALGASLAALAVMAMSVAHVRLRVNREVALRKNMARYKLIAQETSDIICVHDANTGALKEISHSAERLLGQSAEGMVEGSLLDLMQSAQDLERMQLALAKATLLGSSETELEMRHANGSILYVSYVATAVRDRRSDKITEILAVIRDISDQVKYEKQLRRARDTALETSRLKSSFLANMSHELRTPLNAIIGFSDMIGQEMLGPVGNKKYEEYVGAINDSGNHLLELINDVLDMAKIEAGKFKLKIEPLAVPEITAECLKMMQGRALDANVELNVDLGHDLGKILNADHRAVKQILLNLLSNSLKFTKSGGEIFVLTNTVTKVGADHFILSVRDTGSGIPEDLLSNIGKPFVQVQNTPDHAMEGSGLGLSICKAMARLHGGEMLIESEMGIGTTVHIHLPYQKLAEQPITLAA